MTMVDAAVFGSFATLPGGYEIWLDLPGMRIVNPPSDARVEDLG
jgi:hypothetical protein